MVKVGKWQQQDLGIERCYHKSLKYTVVYLVINSGEFDFRKGWGKWHWAFQSEE